MLSFPSGKVGVHAQSLVDGERRVEQDNVHHPCMVDVNVQDCWNRLNDAEPRSVLSMVSQVNGLHSVHVDGVDQAYRNEDEHAHDHDTEEQHVTNL